MKQIERIEYKGYYITQPSRSFWYEDSAGVAAFPASAPLFYFKSVRAAKCWITRHLAAKA